MIKKTMNHYLSHILDIRSTLPKKGYKKRVLNMLNK